MLDFETIRSQARVPGGIWGCVTDREAVCDFRRALRAPFIPAPLPRAAPLPRVTKEPVISARRSGRGARPWIAQRDGADLVDKRGRPRRFASKAAALAAGAVRIGNGSTKASCRPRNV